ncbi:hypothetical protein C8N24_0647 [Solirubrobacter pauli]|uniref:Uncharacterized protein n=1 Tax=Solirubrobacter pauli TaxID=166793 RepID=A0A660L744_9ACTN|nr:hypothetical protein C8N24_0647 [Solirubrobacter pauli]
MPVQAVIDSSDVLTPVLPDFGHFLENHLDRRRIEQQIKVHGGRWLVQTGL